MTVLSPTALIAAQVYGAAAQPRREQPAQQAQKPEQTPRFSVDDHVTLRSAPAPQGQAAKAPDKKNEAQSASSDTAKRDNGVGRREAVTADKPAYKRPGSLVDIRA